ncbi:unnamed protein product [Adineta steineri]|uniref:Uncharacterized protein n=1 Tax=Adineta steineri TaxID=433720 RepID=A0A814K2G8_9BILA|nr:unnamed protein product [Adineta steineri]CAF1045363.1 unnamed protein product [Adineta steineri]
MSIAYRFLSRFASGYIRRTICNTSNTFIRLIPNESRRYKSSDLTGVTFSPIPDAELKIQLYYKTQEIKKRKEKLKVIAESIWNQKSNVNYARITFNECKTMFEEQTGRAPSSWEAKQIYSVTLEKYAPWRHFQEEKERQQHVTAMIEEIYSDLQRKMKEEKDLTLSKSDMTVLLEKKLGELPVSTDIQDMWMLRFRLPLVKWIE